MKYNQGIFRPKFKEKYIGNVDNIVYRSGLELNFFHYFDNKKSILKWGSEEITIKYLYSLDKSVHTYFPDIIIEYMSKSNDKKKAIIEIKSQKEVVETIYYLLQKFDRQKGLELCKQLLKINDENKIAELLSTYKKPKKQTKKYLEYLNQLIKNIDKWIYALEFCKRKNMKFFILTENDLK